jgi:tetratricopeptide (TPR) repeat protein
LAFAEDDPLSLAWVLVMSLDDPVLRLHGLNQLAQRLTALDRDEEALGVLDEALMLAEDSRMADFALAELSVQLAGQGLFADADKVLGYVQDEEHRLAAAIQVLPAYARNDAVTARTRMHAIQTLVDAIDAPLAKARLLARLGETWAEMRDPMLADLLFVKAERIFQDAPMNEMRGLAEDALAGSLSRSCRNDRALALLDHPGVAPNAAYIQNRVAECLAGSGETIAAAAALRRINAYGIGTDPDPVNRGFALADSARVRARMGDSASALSLFGSAVALSVQTQDPVRQQLLHQFIALELGAADLDPSVDRRRLLTGMLYHHYPPAEFR